MTTEISLPEEMKAAIDAEASTTEQTFQWAKQWYPVAVVDFLDPSRPHALQLLGQDIVLWRDGSGQWRCFADACPHRLVPLSEGRVEADGTLLCAYHAWRFDGTGQCVSIPQSQDKDTELKHCTNPRSCAVVYPTQERQGLLWVWAEPGEQAQVESQLKSPRLVPELEENSDRVVKLFWNIRDLPYGWDFFMENVADPAHVPVSHHGIVGSRYQDAQYYDMVRLRPMSTQEGFSYEITPVTNPAIDRAIHDFQPPCHMRIITTYKTGGALILALYATPTRPGWCRHIGCQVLVKTETGKTPKGLGFFALPMPIWLGHVLAALFLHQDLVFLHYQEKSMAQRHQRWLEAVFTPNPQDKMIIAFRQWLEKRAGGGIGWAEAVAALPPSERDKQKLFDVWSTHTQECQVCQSALKRIRQLSLLAYTIAAVLLIIGVMVDARSIALNHADLAGINPLSALLTIAPPIEFWLAVGAAALVGGAGYGLKRLSRLFYVYEFEHAHND